MLKLALLSASVFPLAVINSELLAAESFTTTLMAGSLLVTSFASFPQENNTKVERPKMIIFFIF